MVKWIEKRRLEIMGLDPHTSYSGMLYFLMECFISSCAVEFNFLLKLSGFLKFDFFYLL